MRHRRWIPAGFLVLGLLAAACGSQSPGASSAGSTASPSGTSQSTPAASQHAVLKTAKTSLGTVLTNARGFTLYWFAIDTPTTSKCTGGCLGIWPAVSGTPQPASGVTLPGKVATITRPGGAQQATYKGHPLYTFSGDTKPGQTKGNLINSYGGVWHAMVVSGSTAPSPGPSASSSGYGY